MKKYILVILLATFVIANADEPVREIVKINIRYNNKVYKNYECQVFKIEGTRVAIKPANKPSSKMIWVDIGKNSIPMATAAVNLHEKKIKDYQNSIITTKDLKKGTYLVVESITMFQNLGKKGYLANYNYWSYVNVGGSTARNRPRYNRMSKRSDNLIYIIDPVEIADGRIVNMDSYKREKTFDNKSQYVEHILYKIGLHRYNTRFGVNKTVDKYTTQYSVYKKNMEPQ